MTENQIYIKELYERARRDGLVKNQSMFAEGVGINKTALSQILSEDKTIRAYDAYFKARNWEKAHYPLKTQAAAAVDPDWVAYRRDLARAITERLISQPAAWSCDKRELVKEAVEVSDMLIEELTTTETGSKISAEDVGRIFDKVREEQTKYAATEGCYQEVADWFNKSK